MSPFEAAQMFAEFVNQLETQGFSVEMAADHVVVEGVRVSVGAYEGDPWVVDASQ